MLGISFESCIEKNNKMNKTNKSLAYKFDCLYVSISYEEY